MENLINVCGFYIIMAGSANRMVAGERKDEQLRACISINGRSMTVSAPLSEAVDLFVSKLAEMIVKNAGRDLGNERAITEFNRHFNSAIIEVCRELSKREVRKAYEQQKDAQDITSFASEEANGQSGYWFTASGLLASTMTVLVFFVKPAQEFLNTGWGMVVEIGTILTSVVLATIGYQLYSGGEKFRNNAQAYKQFKRGMDYRVLDWKRDLERKVLQALDMPT